MLRIQAVQTDYTQAKLGILGCEGMHEARKSRKGFRVDLNPAT